MVAGQCREVAGGQPGAPATPEDRLASCAVRQAWEIVFPRHGMPQTSSRATPGSAGRRNGAGHVEPDVGEVLHMLRDEEPPRVEQEHARGRVEPHEFRGAVGAVHASANDDRCKGRSTVERGLVPRAAGVSAQCIHRERGLLNVDLWEAREQLRKRHLASSGISNDNRASLTHSTTQSGVRRGSNMIRSTAGAGAQAAGPQRGEHRGEA